MFLASWSEFKSWLSEKWKPESTLSQVEQQKLQHIQQLVGGAPHLWSEAVQSSEASSELSWGDKQSKCFNFRWDCLEHIFSCQYQGHVSQTFECVCITILYEHTWAYYELILQWKVDKLQPEFPLARIVSQWNGLPPAYQRFRTASRSVIPTIDSADFNWNQP